MSNFWITLEIINCEINLKLAWCPYCVISSNTAVYQAKSFAMTVLTISTQDNVKLLDHLKSGFKRMISWIKFQSKIERQDQILYFDYLFDQTFWGINRHFVSYFQDVADRTSHKIYFPLVVETKDCNVIADERNILEQSFKNDIKTYETIRWNISC